MNFFEKIIYSLSGTMQTPKPLGIFHIASIVFVVTLAIIFCKFFIVSDQKIYKTIIFWCWLSMLLFEVYKQIYCSFNYDGEKVTWKYKWSVFPFQFCSTPLYTLPLILILKDGNIKDAITAYSCTYVMVAGVVVYLLPGTVFTSSVSLNIQTMVHHGIQIFVGIYIAAYNHKKLSFSYLYKGTIVFAIAICMACNMNRIAHLHMDNYFNMFYISPYFESTFPLATWLNFNLPYPMFPILYGIGFFILALIDMLIHKKVFQSTKFENFLEKQLEKQV